VFTGKLVQPFNMGTLNRQETDRYTSDTMIGTLTVNGWTVTFGTAGRGLGGAAVHPGFSSLYQM